MNSKKPVKEQIIEFKKKTGLSRTTYFFIKGMILGRDVSVIIFDDIKKLRIF
jgi:hypothetical protein